MSISFVDVCNFSFLPFLRSQTKHSLISFPSCLARALSRFNGKGISGSRRALFTRRVVRATLTLRVPCHDADFVVVRNQATVSPCTFCIGSCPWSVQFSPMAHTFSTSRSASPVIVSRLMSRGNILGSLLRGLVIEHPGNQTSF